MTTSTRIALVHATALAIDPVEAALQRHWPTADAVNILDDSLTPDRARSVELSDALSHRIISLADYARSLSATGVLFTCSAFGEAIERAGMMGSEPVLKPNEAMFEAALSMGERIAMLYTFAPAAPGMEQEFKAAAIEHYSRAQLTSCFVDGALDALRRGEADRHNNLVAEAAGTLVGYDAILLAHFSTSRALKRATAATDIPVLTAPDAAVLALRDKLEM